MTTATIHPTQTTGFPPVPTETHQKAGGINYSELLSKALTEPGIVSDAYRRFHRFSIGNQILAAMQLLEKKLPLSPIASFSRWQALGRTVQKGERALSLFMPITVKNRSRQDMETDGLKKIDETITIFKLANRWFSLDQTDGAEYSEPMIIPEWNQIQALAQLNITQESFAMVNGNIQGYAVEQRIAINPLAEFPHKTCFHEIAHVVLGHTHDSGCWDAAMLPRNLCEVEAEGVAFLLCSILDLPGQCESRGYIQSWLADDQLTERSAQRIFNATQKIMEAGKPQ
jgi:hypothetical protein